MKQTNPFEIVTSVVVARSVLDPLGPSLTTKMDCEETFETLLFAQDKAGFAYDLVDRVSLVYDGPELVGWYTAEMYDSDAGSIAEVMHPILANELVSADTPVFKLVRLLAERPKSGLVLFVLDQDEIIGTISPQIFDHPVFRLCLFALSLELEEASLSAAMANPQVSWNTLSAARRAKAEEVHNQVAVQSHHKVAQERQAFGPLLASTTISDKGRIVAKLKLLPSRSRSQIESLFASIERVRNWCAHTRDSRDDPPLDFRPKSVAEFVETCTEAISTLRARAKREEETS